MHVLLAAIVLVTGLVTGHDGEALPGCTVTMTSASHSATTTTDAEGKYVFTGVPPGRYELTVRLETFGETRTQVSVSAGENVVPAQVIEFDESQAIVFTCGASCRDERPATRWDLPTCTDYDLATSLIESMVHGDRSARDLLLQRYADAETWAERHRLGSSLLNRMPNDSAIWNELFEHATNAVRFAQDDRGEPPAEFTQWCAERQFDPNQYREMAYEAFTYAGGDPRGLPLLRKALGTDDMGLLFDAIRLLGEQHDESSLPAIEQMLERRKDDAYHFVPALTSFKTERADALAMKYLDEDERANYLSWRNAEP